MCNILLQILNDESVALTSMENNDDSQIQENSIKEKQIKPESKGHENSFKKLKSTAQKFKRIIVKKLSLDNNVKMLKNI